MLSGHESRRIEELIEELRLASQRAAVEAFEATAEQLAFKAQHDESARILAWDMHHEFGTWRQCLEAPMSLLHDASLWQR